MLAVPTAFLEQLHLQVDRWLVAVEHGCLVVNPRPQSRYTLAELLAALDYSQPLTDEDREWIDASAVGRVLSGSSDH
jgi:antitoxin ChpS